jgi:hypothetical protein
LKFSIGKPVSFSYLKICFCLVTVRPVIVGRCEGHSRHVQDAVALKPFLD